MDKKFTFEKLNKHHLPYFYEIRFSVEENIVHPHQIQYLLKKQALDDISQEGGWICKDGDTYAGFCMGLFIPEAIIGGLFVKPEYQSKGIGRYLLKKVTEWMFCKGAKEIKLTTDPLSKAENFYQLQGWKRGEIDEYGTQIIYTKQHSASL